MKELKGIRAKSDSKSDDLSQYIVSDHFADKKDPLSLIPGLHPDLAGMSRPKNPRAASFGQAKGKGARASFMLPNPAPIQAPATDEKEKTVSLANLRQRRISVLQRISNQPSLNLRPGEDSDVPYISDNVVSDNAGM